MNPLEVLQQWFEKLPPEIQSDPGPLAAMIAQDLVPSFDESGASADELTGVFSSALKSSSGSPMAAVGKVLAFAAIVDFVFMGRSTKEDWNKVVPMNKLMAQRAKAEGNDSFLKTVETTDARYALRGAMWIREAERWKELRSTSLSPVELDQWLKAELAAYSR